jgi:hypothetical protein
MIEMYPGTSGRTQGERNERMPATKAVTIENPIELSINPSV